MAERAKEDATLAKLEQWVSWLLWWKVEMWIIKIMSAKCTSADAPLPDGRTDLCLTAGKTDELECNPCVIKGFVIVHGKVR